MSQEKSSLPYIELCISDKNELQSVLTHCPNDIGMSDGAAQNLKFLEQVS